MYYVSIEEPVKCPKCGDWAHLYIDTDTMISTYWCVRSHQPTRKANKKEKALAMKVIASEIGNPQLMAMANLMVSIIVDK